MKVLNDNLLDDLDKINDGRISKPIAALIKFGRKKTYVTIDDILTFFPEAERDVSQLEDAFSALLRAGISYVEDDTSIEPADDEVKALAEKEKEEEEKEDNATKLDENYLANIDRKSVV